MPIPKEIQAAVKKIDEKVAELNRMKAGLIALFGGEHAVVSTSVPLPVQKMISDHAGKRAEQIADYLRVNGPSTRQQIIAGSGVPEGTVSFTLSRSERFEKYGDGRWTLKFPKSAFKQREEATEVASQGIANGS